jgi:DNA anti-recombination protein RmuC
VDEMKLLDSLSNMLDERMGALEERLSERLEERLGAKLEERLTAILDAKLLAMEERWDAKLDAKLAPIAEKLGAVYEHVARLSDDMTEVKQRLAPIEGDILRHERILKDHNHRLADVEQELRVSKQ